MKPEACKNALKVKHARGKPKGKKPSGSAGVANPKEKGARKTKKKSDELPLYVVQRIDRVEYNPTSLRCKFLVVWKKVNSSDGPTWEPIENILSTPRFIRDMEERMYLEWQEECESQGKLVTGWKKPLNLHHCVEPGFCYQYVMTGSEKLVKIATITRNVRPLEVDQSSTVLENERDDSYCLVRFRHDEEYHWVHIGFIEYYFPTDLALFLFAQEIVDD